MELQTIKRLCYRECDQEVVAQLMECPSEALKYTSQMDWLVLGLSCNAAKNMADFINSALSLLTPRKPPKIKNSNDIIDLLWKEFKHDIEYFYVIVVNNSNYVVHYERVAIGGLCGVSVDIRVVLRMALSYNGTGIFAIHNHPSGSSTPSRLDIDITKRLREACDTMDIRLIDHLIITPDRNNVYSFCENGLL